MTDQPSEKTLFDVWQLLGAMDAKLDRVVDDAADHAERLTKLENAKHFERGVVAAIAATISTVITYLKVHHT